MNKSFVIVIPIYLPTLTEDEQISVRRLRSLYAVEHLCLVTPPDLPIPPALKGIRVEEFDAHFFQGIAGYNQLMLHPDFYARFSQYDYMLIHQTDAFIFRDELQQWCNKGYSYVGAPWLIKRKYQGLGRILLHLRAIPYRLRKIPFLPLDFGNKVGNGGLSLRHISEFLTVCLTQQEQISHFLSMSATCRQFNEDCFWATRNGWTYPSHLEALQFSIDLGPEDAFVQNNQQLPMGCHGWTKPPYRSFWWHFIPSYIPTLP